MKKQTAFNLQIMNGPACGRIIPYPDEPKVLVVSEVTKDQLGNFVRASWHDYVEIFGKYYHSEECKCRKESQSV